MRNRNITPVMCAAGALIISFIFSLTSCTKQLTAFPLADELLTTTENSSAAVLISTGSVTRDHWQNVTGNDVAQIPVSTSPSSTSSLSSLDAPLNECSDCADRIRGYVNAPASGNYVFWLSGDDAAELWLSSSDDPAGKKKIAYLLSWSSYHEWGKFSSQQSASIPLTAGKKYYVEILHKQGGGGSHVSVQWRLPSGTMESPVPGWRLSPYTGTTPTAETYKTASPISLTGAHDITISGMAIAGGTVPSITLNNCYNVHITKNKLYNSSEVGIHLIYCRNITADYNYFTNVSSGVYAEQTTQGGIVANSNQFLNMRGPFPHGQFVQFNNVRGPNSSISNNKGQNDAGKSYAEDAISLYQSAGTQSSPVQINGNWIRGGGPSSSGGGIMLGDKGGSYLTASNNILVDPGMYGMSIAGGDHEVISNNSIYARSQSFTNVGIYVNSIGGYTESSNTVSNNKVNFYNANNYNNNAWLAPGCQKPVGWDGNSWGAAIGAGILPAVIITSQ